MKRHDVPPADLVALTEAAAAERAARAAWQHALRQLRRVIHQASRHGASLRAIAQVIGRSHGRVHELLSR